MAMTFIPIEVTSRLVPKTAPHTCWLEKGLLHDFSHDEIAGLSSYLQKMVKPLFNPNFGVSQVPQDLNIVAIRKDCTGKTVYGSDEYMYAVVIEYAGATQVFSNISQSEIPNKGDMVLKTPSSENGNAKRCKIDYSYLISDFRSKAYQQLEASFGSSVHPYRLKMPLAERFILTSNNELIDNASTNTAKAALVNYTATKTAVLAHFTSQLSTLTAIRDIVKDRQAEFDNLHIKITHLTTLTAAEQKACFDELEILQADLDAKTGKKPASSAIAAENKSGASLLSLQNEVQKRKEQADFGFSEQNDLIEQTLKKLLYQAKLKLISTINQTACEFACKSVGNIYPDKNSDYYTKYLLKINFYFAPFVTAEMVKVVGNTFELQLNFADHNLTTLAEIESAAMTCIENIKHGKHFSYLTWTPFDFLTKNLKANLGLETTLTQKSLHQVLTDEFTKHISNCKTFEQTRNELEKLSEQITHFQKTIQRNVSTKLMTKIAEAEAIETAIKLKLPKFLKKSNASLGTLDQTFDNMKKLSLNSYEPRIDETSKMAQELNLAFEADLYKTQLAEPLCQLKAKIRAYGAAKAHILTLSPAEQLNHLQAFCQDEIPQFSTLIAETETQLTNQWVVIEKRIQDIKKAKLDQIEKDRIARENENKGIAAIIRKAEEATQARAHEQAMIFAAHQFIAFLSDKTFLNSLLNKGCCLGRWGGVKIADAIKVPTGAAKLIALIPQNSINNLAEATAFFNKLSVQAAEAKDRSFLSKHFWRDARMQAIYNLAASFKQTPPDKKLVEKLTTINPAFKAAEVPGIKKPLHIGIGGIPTEADIRLKTRRKAI